MLSNITGIPFWIVTIILSAIAYSYSRFSGLKASVATDVLQLGIILIGGAIIAPWCLLKSGGIDTLFSGLGAISGDYTSLFSETGLAVFLGFGLPTAIGLISGPFGDQCFWQRAFAIKKDKIGKAFLVGALVFALVPIAMGGIGFIARRQWLPSTGCKHGKYGICTIYSPQMGARSVFDDDFVRTAVYVDSNLCAAAAMTTDWQITDKLKNADNISFSRKTMILLLIVSNLIAYIPGLTVTHLFLFYGTLRASTLMPTVITLLGKRLNADGVFYGILASLLIGLPVFAVGNILNIAAVKTIGSLATLAMSGVIALVASRKGAIKCQ